MKNSYLNFTHPTRMHYIYLGFTDHNGYNLYMYRIYYTDYIYLRICLFKYAISTNLNDAVFYSKSST